MNTLAKRLSILVLLTLPLLNSACTTTGSSTARSVAPRPEVKKTLRTGNHVTVLQKNGAIGAFTVSKVEGKVVHGTTAADTRVSIRLDEIEYASRNPQPEISLPKGGVAHSVLGAFAKTGQVAGKVALTGVAVIGAAYGGGCASGEFIESIW